MSCEKKCPIMVICQRKHNPPPACISAKNVIVENGYRTMAIQEQRMRNSAIDYKGDWNV